MLTARAPAPGCLLEHCDVEQTDMELGLLPGLSPPSVALFVWECRVSTAFSYRL